MGQRSFPSPKQQKSRKHLTIDFFLLKLYISLLQKPGSWLGKPSWGLHLLGDPCSYKSCCSISHLGSQLICLSIRCRCRLLMNWPWKREGTSGSSVVCSWKLGEFDARLPKGRVRQKSWPRRRGRSSKASAAPVTPLPVPLGPLRMLPPNAFTWTPPSLGTKEF